MSLYDQVFLSEAAKAVAAPAPGGEEPWRKKFGDKPWEHKDPKHILSAYKALHPRGSIEHRSAEDLLKKHKASQGQSRPSRLGGLPLRPERPKPKTPPTGNENWRDVAKKRRKDLDPGGEKWIR